jgi:hypothetical protein
MRRREFLIRSATAAGAAWLSSKSVLTSLANATLPAKFAASDTVTLGSTGIKTSRLAMGTGTVGSGHHSHQTALGVQGLSDLLLNGYDHGLRFFDAADSYGSHPHVAEALKHVPRDKVTVLTKTFSRDAASARADLDRFRRELGTDYLDICLMHCVTEGDWTERYKGTSSRKRSRRELSARTVAPATPSKPCEPPPSLHGSRSTWPASIPSARSWTPIPQR